MLFRCPPTSALQRVLKRETPTIFLTDTNAHLGSTLSPMVGLVEGERERDGCSRFHALLLEFQVGKRADLEIYCWTLKSH